MRFLGAGVVDIDLGAAFGVVVRVGPILHDFAGESDDGGVFGGIGVLTAGAKAGGVVCHVAFVGGGEEGEGDESKGEGFHCEGDIVGR